jgi:hypothetical protein
VLLMESRKTACSLALSSLPVKTHSRHCLMIGACRTSIPLPLCAAVAPFLETYWEMSNFD